MIALADLVVNQILALSGSASTVDTFQIKAIVPMFWPMFWGMSYSRFEALGVPVQSELRILAISGSVIVNNV